MFDPTKAKIKVFGKASNKLLIDIIVPKLDLYQNILKWLLKHDIPIAWSCGGEGLCQKCIINNEELACINILKDLYNKENNTVTINIEYL